MVQKNKHHTEDIPEHVSWQVRDAWMCIPPCNYSENPYCHVDCPYFYECHPQDEYYEDENW